MEELTYKKVWVGDRHLDLLEQAWADPERDYITRSRLFAQTCCGLGWPSDKPGALVVVGETLESHPWKPGLHVLHAEENQDTGRLLERFSEVKRALKFTSAFTDCENGPMMRFLSQFNHFQSGKGGRGMALRHAAFFEPDGSIFAQLQTVKLLLGAGDKRLHFGDHPRIAAALAEIPADRMHTMKSEDNPLLSALGYAVSWLQAYPFQVELPKKKRAEYNPLGPDDSVMNYDPFKGL